MGEKAAILSDKNTLVYVHLVVLVVKAQRNVDCALTKKEYEQWEGVKKR